MDASAAARCAAAMRRSISAAAASAPPPRRPRRAQRVAGLLEAELGASAALDGVREFLLHVDVLGVGSRERALERGRVFTLFRELNLQVNATRRRRAALAGEPRRLRLRGVAPRLRLRQRRR